MITSRSLDHGGAIKCAGLHEAYGNGLGRGYGNNRYCDVGHGLDLQGDGTSVTYLHTKCDGAHVWRMRHDYNGTPRGPFTGPEKYHHDDNSNQSNKMDMTDHECRW